MSTPNIRLAFQGGGAKLIPMLAVAEAVHNAQRSELVVVDAVSGTSAGSICAALLALKADFPAVRRIISEKGSSYLSSLISPEVARIKSKLEKNKKIGWIDAWTHRKLIEKVFINGTPILSEDALPNFVKDVLFAAVGANNIHIDDIRPNLSIISSDVSKSIGVVNKSGDLVSAIINSCSLPVLLRSFSALSNTHEVDGGLCENLPVELLLGDAHIPVFAVYPKTTPDSYKIDNLALYLISLFSASINHNTARSQMMVSKPFRFEVEVDFGMLDFEKAISLISDELKFQRMVDEYYARLENFSRSFGVKRSVKQSRVTDILNYEEYSMSLLNITSDYSDFMEFKEAKFLVRMNCDKVFESDGELGKRIPDTVKRTTSIVSSVDGLKYYRASVLMSENSIIPTVWSAFNVTKNMDIPIRALPLSVDNSPGASSRYCLIEFLDAKKNISKNDLIEVEGVYHCPAGNDLRNLNLRKADTLGITNSQEKVIPSAEIILTYPRKVGKISMVPTMSEKGGTRPVKEYENIVFDKKYTELLDNDFSAVGVKVKDFSKNDHLKVELHVI